MAKRQSDQELAKKTADNTYPICIIETLPKYTTNKNTGTVDCVITLSIIPAILVIRVSIFSIFVSSGKEVHNFLCYLSPKWTEYCEVI